MTPLKLKKKTMQINIIIICITDRKPAIALISQQLPEVYFLLTKLCAHNYVHETLKLY